MGFAYAQGTGTPGGFFSAQGTGHAFAPSQGSEGGAVAFSPTDISGLLKWHNDTSLFWQDSARTTPVTANNDPIGSWDDLSGNGRHAIQATAGLRPLYKTGAQNGRVGVLYDGVDDVLTTAAVSYGAFTMFAAIKMTTANMLFGHNTAGDEDYQYRNGSSIEVNRSATKSAANVDAGAGWMDGTYIIVHRFDGTHAGHSVRRNGAALAVTDVSAGNPGTGASSGTLAIGARSDGSLTSAGHVLEIGFYDASLSAGNTTSIETYLNSRWAVF